MYNRRHHCRHCGILCCDTCSTKRVPHPEKGDKKGAPLKRCRVCDSCFNQLNYSYICRKRDFNGLEKAKRDADKAAAAAAQKSSAEGGGAAKRSIFSWASNSGSTSSLSSLANATNATAGSTTKDAGDEAMDALVERGEKIALVADKAAEMNEAASEFNRATKQLLKQQQNASMWG